MNQHFQNGCARAEKEIQNKLLNMKGDLGWAARAITAGRREQAESKMEYELVRLNANGSPRNTYDSVQKFKTEKEALDKVKYWRSINPGKKLRFTLNGREV